MSQKKIKPAGWEHTIGGSCDNMCFARLASQRLYGDGSHAVSPAQVAKQRDIEAAKATAAYANSPFAPLATKSDLVYSPPRMDDITKRFSSHPMGSMQQARSGAVRTAIKEAADFVQLKLTDGREKSLALTHLEEALFWSTASIAREGK